jgi:hypothetical protein
MPSYTVDPQLLATGMFQLYQQFQLEVTELLAKRLAQGLDVDELPQWALAKQAQLLTFHKQIERLVAELNATSSAELQQQVYNAFLAGSTAAVRDGQQLGVELPNDPLRPTLAGGFGGVNRFTLSALLLSSVGKLQGANVQILRQTDDAYRAIVAEVATAGVGGVATRRQVTQRALQKFADAGITGFVDKAGRNWNLASYAEMATRSTITQAQVQGYVDRLQANGHDLVIVSDSPAECPLCRPWEGKVLSISGRDPAHSSLDDARSTGLFHSNCTHHVGIYLPGITPDYKDTEDSEGYVQKQRQRELERRVRKYKRRQAAAIDEDARRAAGKQVRQAQKTLREHVAQHGLKRLRYREQIEGGTARKTGAEPTSLPKPVPSVEPPIVRRPTTYADLDIVAEMERKFLAGEKTLEQTGQEDPIMEAIAAATGGNGAPHVVSETDLQAYIAAGELELYRGISGVRSTVAHQHDPTFVEGETPQETALRRAEEFRSGRFFIGVGGIGNGAYAAAGANALEVASGYAGGAGQILHLSVRADAKVITHAEAERQRQAEILALTQQGLSPAELVARINVNWDASNWAAMHGYDIIHFEATSGHLGDEYIIMNRTAVRVAQENVGG